MLRTRLFLNLIPFVAVLLGVGAYAILLFSRLAHEVDVSVVDNHRCAMAAQTMKAAVSGMSESLRQAVRADTASATNEFREHSRVFENNLSLQVSNAHLFADKKIPEQLRSRYQSFRDAGVALLRLNQRREQQQMLERDVVPRELAVKLLLDRIAKVTQKNILATSRNIHEINRRINHLMIFAVAVALLISVIASFETGRSILRPIQSLTRAAREIGKGNLDQAVPVVSRDELGELGAAFNKMADQLKVYRESTTEQIVRLHHTMTAALASFPDPVFVLDRQGRIELKNRAAQELVAWLALNDRLPGHLADVAKDVLRTGESFRPHSFKEALALRIDGEERAFLPRILTMRGEQNEAVGVAVVLHDVTRFRLLDAAKTNLVATVSHELKTPLTSVRMVLFMLLEKTLGPLSGKQAELLQTARKEAERLLRILNDLLDLTRLEAGHSGLNRERLSPARLVQMMQEEARQHVLECGLTLVVSVQPQLPDVSVDRQRISHVFQNFLTNAIKHSPPAGEIQLRASRAGGGVRFSVADQGPGVPEVYQGRIFDRFFRVPGQARTGAGLGLSIAREITIAHGGRIGVRSEPGQGSEFYIVLPKADEEARAGAKATWFTRA
jgi:signal transduction histidine kinase